MKSKKDILRMTSFPLFYTKELAGSASLPLFDA